MHFLMWTNIFCNLDRYILQFGQINFAICPNTLKQITLKYFEMRNLGARSAAATFKLTSCRRRKNQRSAHWKVDLALLVPFECSFFGGVFGCSFSGGFAIWEILCTPVRRCPHPSHCPFASDVRHRGGGGPLSN